MMRFVASCVWICVVTAASIYAGGTFKLSRTEATEANNRLEGLEHKKTAPINVPMIVNGNIEGYVVAQFVYLIDSKNAKQLSVPLEAFIADEAFRTLYSDQMDFNHLEKYDVPALTQELIRKVNQRLGGDIVKDVLVEEFNYVPKRDISK
ncbi:hypothetical protein RZS28_12675 [Methylocapsa polymorpha]|uniref:Flagellar protein FliL n=1 Tax=Methylocapsa polymorpha TaxID=3080828 RepID=A0ABZ0HRW3_9HYPH|nr:hypothetical protein RZS28_12675 [Methylocapsa sp. RX1]